MFGAATTRHSVCASSVRLRARGARAVLAGIVSAALMTTACTRPACENQAFYGLPSPDGRYIAFIFHRTCPAPEGVTTQVSLLPFHESLRGDSGNVLGVAGKQDVKVSWHGPKILSVSGFDHAGFRREGPIDGIGIEFQQ